MANGRFKRSTALAVSVAVLAAAVIFVAILCRPCFKATTVILVRHAEKEPGGNPSLTDDGDARALELAEVGGEAGVSAIYATEWCRTVLTAKPLAEALGLKIQVQNDPNGSILGPVCDPEIPQDLVEELPPYIDTPAMLVDHILTNNKRKAVLIVGHSNTVPDLIAELGQGAFDPMGDLMTFDRLFVVTRYNFLLASRLIKARYGQP